MPLKLVLNERVFNNDIVMADSVALFCVCDLKQLSVLNRSYSLFADSLAFRTALLYFTIKYNSLMLVILLNTTYIWPWLKDFWDSKSKLTTPTVKLRPCTLWTVQAHDSVKKNCVLLRDGYCLFLQRPNNASHFFIGTQWCCRAVTSDLIDSNPALSSLDLT